ncbi:MAG TPA: hypothetical protein VGI78_22035 [Acetobacteraceae bacterium]
MTDSLELHVALKPAPAEAVQQAGASAEYASQDEVVSEALLEWRLRRELDAAERDALCRLWDEGLASGPGQFGSMDEIRREAHQLQRERSSPAKR